MDSYVPPIYSECILAHSASLRCVLSCAAVNIVIAPVCLFVGRSALLSYYT